MPKLTGTLEHTAQMANSINTAIIKQRSVVIILLDLKYEFCKVHHSLISEVLRNHCTPDLIQQLIQSLYSNMQTYVVTETGSLK